MEIVIPASTYTNGDSKSQKSKKIHKKQEGGRSKPQISESMIESCSISLTPAIQKIPMEEVLKKQYNRYIQYKELAERQEEAMVNIIKKFAIVLDSSKIDSKDLSKCSLPL